MKTVGVLMLGGFVALSFWASQAQALPQFKKAFENKYVKTSTDEDFKAAEKKASCSVCHVKGEEKTSRNAYGQALSKFTGGHLKKQIDAAKDAAGGDDDAKDAAAKPIIDKALKTLDEAFDKVADEKAPGGGTFGERIKEGKLPVDVPAGK